ncbi:MAG: tetratricopeptide repeat protein [Blastocatellia bacterium]
MINCSQKWSLIFASLILCQPIPIIELKASPRNTVQETTSTQQSTKELTPLELGKAIERELKADESHSYFIELKANDYLNLVVEQKGIDVVLRLFSPSGEQLQEVDSPNGTQGEEPLEIVLDKEGTYRLEIASPEKEAKTAKYQALIKELRASTEQDIELNKATKLNVGVESLYDQGKYDQALPMAIQALEIRKSILGENHALTSSSIHELGLLYLNKGQYTKAEELFSQAIEIREKSFGKNHILTASSTDYLAAVYSLRGELVKAESFFIKALEIKKKVLNENHQDIARTMTGLGLVYEKKGDYAKAEPIYTQAIEIYSKSLGENHYSTAQAINNLASLYLSKGDYTKAEPLSNRVVEIFEKALGAEHADVGLAINNLATLYNIQGNYEKAEPLYVQTLKIFRKALGESHHNTAQVIGNLAILYFNKGEYEKAETLLTEAVATFKKSLGENNFDTAGALEDLGSFYNNRKKYEKAEPILVEALAIYRKTLTETNPHMAAVLQELVKLYFGKREYKKAVEYIKEANNVREGELARNLAIGSEKSKQIYLQKYARETDLTLSLQIQTAPNNAQATEIAFVQVLRRKGRSIDAANQSIEALRKRASKGDIELLDELTNKKKLYSNLTTQGLGKLTSEQYKEKLKILQEEIEKLEYKVSEQSVEFRTQSQPITLEAIQKAVAKGSTLVEFASYKVYNAKENEYGTRRYVVYLLNNEGEPLWADLGEAEIIDKVVDELRTKLKSKKTSIHREIKPLARRLDKLVMQPVRKLTKKGNRLLIAPDGKLNLVPFAALVDERGKFLVENYPISYLTSGRDLLRLQVKIESKSNPVIIGNPDFGEVEAKNEKDSKVGASVFSELYFAPLKATEIEAKAIKQLLPSANLLMQKEANEQALTSLNAPSILHIATHGFFLTEEDLSTTQTTDKDQESSRIAKKEKSASSGEQTISSTKLENPLLRSGIALAGANLNQENNGIFTALKTTGLNLWGTKVVVLSACDTGVGEVKTGDGIYGLRRALVLAGSESQVMSLWPVSDNGTKDLMIAYYTKLEKGIGRSDALRQVQLELLKNPKRRHPFYWASFIQSGEWANLDGKR